MDFLHLHKLTQNREKKKKHLFLFSERFLHVLHLVFYFLIILLISGMVLIFAKGAKFLPSAVNVYNKTMAGKEKIESIENLLKESKDYSMEMFYKAETNLSQAKRDFQEAKESLENLKLFKKIPGVKNQYIALDNLLAAAIETNLCLEEIVKWLNENMAKWLNGYIVKGLNEQNLSFDKINKKEILESLSNSNFFWQERKKQIKKTEDLLNSISLTGLISPIQKMVQDFKERLILLERGIKEVNFLSQILPSMLGLNQEKNYLFLLQNNTELRPSGGFLGTYGILKIKDGEILSFKTDDIYNLDKKVEGILEIEPPWPLKRYNRVEHWFMRDANWSPDFPTTARKVEWFYNIQNVGDLHKSTLPSTLISEKSRGSTQISTRKNAEGFDGVIAIDPNFVEDLFDLTGPIKIKNIEFTKENFIDLLEWQVEQAFWWQGIPKEKRKAIIQDLSEKIQEKIFGLSIDQGSALYKIINKNLEEKHILLYFHDSNLEDYILTKNWGGKVWTASPGASTLERDYIMVIDANMASLKTDPVVKRSINYDLILSDWQDHPEESSIRDPVTKELPVSLKLTSPRISAPRHAKLTITYDHQGKFTWKTTRYRTYLRVYLPKGSELIRSVILNRVLTQSEAKSQDEVKGSREISVNLHDIEITQELGKTVFGTFISIEPGEKKSLVFEYKLPEKIIQQIKNGQYYLLVQKQPGTKAHGLNLNLKFPQPLKSASPAERREEWGDNIYKLETDLRVDREFTVIMRE